MNTTLYIRAEILKIIIQAACSNGKTFSEMIALLIKEGIANLSASNYMGRMVRYQSRDIAHRGRAIHVRLSKVDYEYFLDLRRLQKMSVSLILALAVRKFSIEQEYSDASDNYQWKSYILIKEAIGTIIIWKHVWGFPLTHGKCVYSENSS